MVLISSIERRSGSNELLLGRRRIELEDLRKTIFLRGVRTGDEGAAHLGGVPAGHHAETRRFFGFDVTRGKNLHEGSFGATRSQIGVKQPAAPRIAPFV